jgi:hypothetical protein
MIVSPLKYEQSGEEFDGVPQILPHFVTAAFAAGQTNLVASMNSRIAEHLRRAAGLRLFPFPFESPKMNYGFAKEGGR